MQDGSRTGKAIERRRLMERIRLLCTCGAGLEAIASQLTHSIRDLIGADSGSIFWVDPNGSPAGFYHDSAPAELKDLFIVRFADLFDRPDEVNMRTLIEFRERSIGRALEPDYLAGLWRGNVYRELCVPLGHRYMLDMRVDVGEFGRSVVCLWNRSEQPFEKADAAALIPVQHLVQRAIEGPGAEALWRSAGDGTAHFICDMAGQLVAISPAAEKMLMESHLLGQRISMTQQLGSAPAFALQLAHELVDQKTAVLRIPVTDGRIVAQASRTRAVKTDGRDLMFVSLDLQVAIDVLLIDYLMTLALTPVQREIAIYGARGGARSECHRALGVGQEALKKHLAAIFEATATSRWADLEQLAVRAFLPRAEQGDCAVPKAIDRKPLPLQKS